MVIDMNIDHILQAIQATCENYYEPGDPMRWPYQVGMLESKLREMAYLLTNAQERIKDLETEIIALQKD
jgi:hypothetical protein